MHCLRRKGCRPRRPAGRPTRRSPSAARTPMRGEQLEHQQAMSGRTWEALEQLSGQSLRVEADDASEDHVAGETVRKRFSPHRRQRARVVRLAPPIHFASDRSRRGVAPSAITEAMMTAAERYTRRSRKSTEGGRRRPRHPTTGSSIRESRRPWPKSWPPGGTTTRALITRARMKRPRRPRNRGGSSGDPRTPRSRQRSPRAPGGCAFRASFRAVRRAPLRTGQPRSGGSRPPRRSSGRASGCAPRAPDHRAAR